MNDRTLPEQFNVLEPWLDWALPTEPERYARRIGTAMNEIKAFHAALLPHMESVIRYLAQFEWGQTIDGPDRRLFHLGLAFMEASVPVDLGWKQGENEGVYSFARVDVPYRP